MNEDEIRTLSRIVIETGPGTSLATANYAAFRQAAPIGMDVETGRTRPIPKRPISLKAREELGKITIEQSARADDREGRIVSQDLPAQIQELADSGILGRLLVEPLGRRKIVISSHAGSQAERNAWVRELSIAKGRL